jgi:hypothetical protein
MTFSIKNGFSKLKKLGYLLFCYLELNCVQQLYFIMQLHPNLCTRVQDFGEHLFILKFPNGNKMEHNQNTFLMSSLARFLMHNNL